MFIRGIYPTSFKQHLQNDASICDLPSVTRSFKDAENIVKIKCMYSNTTPNIPFVQKSGAAVNTASSTPAAPTVPAPAMQKQS